MKITAVEAYLLSFPLPGSGMKRDAMLIRVSTSEGLFGYAPGEPTASSKRLIDRLIAPFLTGRSLTDPDALRVLFQQGPGADAEASRIYGAVEIALYDLAGKARNLPVSELIGGRVRDRIRLYSTGPREPGFRAFRTTAADAHAAREAAGPELDMMVDASAWQQKSFEEVESAARALSELEVRWIEEPFPPADHESYARLRALEIVPLAAGRNEPNELRLLDLIETPAVDYIQMDIVSQGSYAAARRLFPDIARAGLRFAFQCGPTPLDVVAAAHLGICWPESVVRWLEYPLPIASEILKAPLQIERGSLIVPSGPGLGVDVDESVIWRYPYLEAPVAM